MSGFLCQFSLCEELANNLVCECGLSFCGEHADPTDHDCVALTRRSSSSSATQATYVPSGDDESIGPPVTTPVHDTSESDELSPEAVSGDVVSTQVVVSASPTQDVLGGRGEQDLAGLSSDLVDELAGEVSDDFVWSHPGDEFDDGFGCSRPQSWHRDGLRIPEIGDLA